MKNTAAPRSGSSRAANIPRDSAVRGSSPESPSQSAAQRTQARYAAIRALMILESSDRPLSAALEDALRNGEDSSTASSRTASDQRNRAAQNSDATPREYSHKATKNRATQNVAARQDSDVQKARDSASTFSELPTRDMNFPVSPARADAPEISRGFVRELVTGVCRHRARLDFTLAPLLKKPLEKLDAPVRAALRLAAYERIALDTPAHVVANEYAEAMRAARLKSAVGFVNAVARKVPETWRDFPEKQRGTAAQLACEYSHPLWLVQRWIARLGFDGARALCAANNEIAPLALRVNTRRADRDALLRELESQELAARAGAFSPDAIQVERAGAPDAWPSWKRGAIIAQDEAAQLVSLFALHGIAPRDDNTTRQENAAPNGGAATPEKGVGDSDKFAKSADFKGALSGDDAPLFASKTLSDAAATRAENTAPQQEDAPVNPTAVGDARHASSPDSTFAEGAVAVSTPPFTAGRSLELQHAATPFTVIDLCAAPGGKATHLAQFLGDDARVLALDSAPGRVQLIKANAARLGFKIETFSGDILDASTREMLQRETGGADVVLVDAPCLGTGTLRRRPDAKWRKTPSQLAELVILQRELLDAAATTVRVGGVLVYSTCSLEPEENEEQARAFLARHSEYSLLPPRDVAAPWNELLTDEGFLRTSPAQHGCDGAFAARFRRNQ